jgi:RNA polymerase sigma-70 factor (ECF subfamily)
MILVRDNDDEEAYEELFKRHRKKTLDYIKRKNFYAEDSEDLAQLVWVKIWLYRKTFNEVYKFPGWHWGICRNVFNERLRGNRGITVSLDEATSPSTEMVVPSTLQCRRAWERLKPEHQEVLKALYIEGLSRKHLGERLNKTQPTIRKMIKEATEEFRLRLADEEIFIDPVEDMAEQVSG